MIPTLIIRAVKNGYIVMSEGHKPDGEEWETLNEEYVFSNPTELITFMAKYVGMTVTNEVAEPSSVVEPKRFNKKNQKG